MKKYNILNKSLGTVYLILLLTAAVTMAIGWQISTRPVPPLDVQKSAFNTFTDLDNQFDFKYPKAYLLGPTDGSGSQNYFGRTGETEAVVILPGDLFPKTNFAESYVTVAQDSTVKNAEDCKKFSNGGAQMAADKSQANSLGINFSSAEFSGAAAGNQYETRLYRIFHAGTCFEISTTLHTTNIGNYPPGSVEEVDKQSAWAKLVQILNSFKFIDKNSQASGQVNTGSSSIGLGTFGGHVSIGPLCPVEREDIPCDPTPQIYRARRIAVYDLKKTLVAAQTLDDDGSFSLDLPAGDYLAAVLPGGLNEQYSNVRIQEGKLTTLDLSVDTGIR
jgi:hypothetical protein